MQEISKIKKMPTDIYGLDEMIFGGIPEGDQVLIYGPPGCGKSLLAFEILYRNAKVDVPAIFFTTQESVDKVRDHFKQAFSYFGDIDSLINEKLISIFDISSSEEIKSREVWTTIIVGITNAIKSYKAKIIVIDSLSGLRSLTSNTPEFTRNLTLIIKILRAAGITTLFTGESSKTKSIEDALGIQDTFMFDGIIELMTEQKQRFLSVVKMRRTDHSLNTIPYEITGRGFSIFKEHI